MVKWMRFTHKGALSGNEIDGNVNEIDGKVEEQNLSERKNL